MSEAGYEVRDARIRTLAATGVGLVVLTGLGLLVAYGVELAFEKGTREERTTRHPMADYREPPAGPALQAIPSVERAAHEAFERERLTTYGWIDQKEGIVRIPVERAMELVLEELR